MRYANTRIFSRHWKGRKIIRCNATHIRFLLLLRPPGIINRDLPYQGAEYKSKNSQDEHPYPSCCCSKRHCVSFLVLAFLSKGKEFPTRYTYIFQDVQGNDEEAEVILREHVGDDVDVADGLHLLRVVGHDRHVHRQEEENHLLGRS